ncbi:MAG: enoyl-CoA hydratase/isomerase family protein [Actinomycetota bacterium]|nr:enoyl-CoA hydratase/isomerase family protein [Actinomycetota bacterium]
MLKLEVEDRVATMLLDRPPVNAVDNAFLDSFDSVLDEIKELNPALVVVRGAGRHFSAGGDIKQMVSALETNDFSSLDAFARRIQNAYFAWEQLPMPTVAVLTGAVTGGGLELALACDLRIAAATARIGFPEVRIGLLPAGGGTQRLTYLIGRGRAMRLILTGELIDGSEAARLGIVEWCAEDAELDARVAGVTEMLLEVAGPAQPAIKRCINRLGTGDGYSGELFEQKALHLSREAEQRLRAFVAER